jgi:hypothetical protein
MPGSLPDLEEIAPGRFIVRDARLNTVLKSEGEVAGQWFTLTGRRREGLFARLRARQFRVLAIEDRIAALPGLPLPPPLGPLVPRPLATSTERLSFFDVRTLRWQPAEAAPNVTPPAVLLRPGWSIRRRKGRGAADYYLATVEGAGVGLRGVSEDRALLDGYASAAADEPLLRAEPSGSVMLLPEIELPAPHRAVLHVIAREQSGRLAVDETAWPFAQDVFERLGVRLIA